MGRDEKDREIREIRERRPSAFAYFAYSAVSIPAFGLSLSVFIRAHLWFPSYLFRKNFFEIGS